MKSTILALVFLMSSVTYGQTVVNLLHHRTLVLDTGMTVQIDGIGKAKTKSNYLELRKILLGWLLDRRVALTNEQSLSLGAVSADVAWRGIDIGDEFRKRYSNLFVITTLTTNESYIGQSSRQAQQDALDARIEASQVGYGAIDWNNSVQVIEEKPISQSFPSPLPASRPLSSQPVTMQPTYAPVELPAYMMPSYTQRTQQIIQKAQAYQTGPRGQAYQNVIPAQWILNRHRTCTGGTCAGGS